MFFRMSDPNLNRRLNDLILAPSEDLDVEVKGWLDLSTGEHKATLAKALLALANHGGGFVLIGFTETDTGMTPSSGRPPSLHAYSQDQVNGIVQHFAEPSFHCAVHHVLGPDDSIYPIISVPGGHRVPIRAKRAGPGEAIVRKNAIYTRRPGPSSEEPQNGREWDELFGRCVSARQDELLESIRNVLSGGVAQPVAASSASRLDAWTEACVSRWHALTDGLPPNDARRCPDGHYWMAYEIQGDISPTSLAALQEALMQSVLRYTGWPTWWVPTRQGIESYAKDGTVECWLGRDGSGVDAAHSDFWRVSPEGMAFLLRGYQEDGRDVRAHGVAPATIFDLTLPIWRVGEAILHAERLAKNLRVDRGEIAFRARYEGLGGRVLDSLSRDRIISPGRISHEDAITVGTTVPISSVAPNLPEIILPLLEPLYALFGFFQLRADIVQSELQKLRSGRF